MTGDRDNDFMHDRANSIRVPPARIETPRLVLRVKERRDASLLVCGHTHMQFDRTVGSVRIVNAGSVGMPFGEPGAHWLLLDEDDAVLRTTRYDLEHAAGLFRRTAYPDAQRMAEMIVTPPSEASMLATFDKLALH